MKEANTTYAANKYGTASRPIKSHSPTNGFYFNRISHRGACAMRFHVGRELRSEACRLVSETDGFHLSLNARMEQSVLCLAIAIERLVRENATL